MCSNLLCLPPEWVDTIYFYILLLANTLNCLIGIASIVLLFRRHCFPKPVVALQATLHEPITVVVPCYLPNEQTIIESTIEHIMLEMDWLGPITLIVVYNTPAPLPFEATLRQLDGREYAPRRLLRVVHAERSTSKADNLNLVVQQYVADDYLAIYDADHHPEPNALRLLMERLHASGVVAVQGSTYIRNARGRHISALARAVDAEFFVTHFVYFPAMEMIASSGYFGGSNALWRTDVLRNYEFDRAMLTEDVDVSARALLDGHAIGFCPEARSGELSPAGALALIAQRLRWFMGWEQVTTKYYWRAFFSGLPVYRVIGFLYLFHLRWILLLAAVLAAVINPICVYTAVSLYIFVAIFAISAAIQHDRPRPLAILSVALFMVMGWVYVIIHFTTHTIAFLRVFTGTEGKWEVTAREIKGTSPATSMTDIPGSSGAGGGGEGNGSRSSWLSWPRISMRVPGLAEPLLGREAEPAGGSRA